MKYKNSVRIQDDFVLKKRNDKVLELYNYLDTINFNNYPKVIDVDEKNIKSEYINSLPFHEMSKGMELIKVMANLHLKSLYYKDVSKNKYRDIYESIISNLEYLKDYYEEILENIELEEYMSPSHYLFARNYSGLLYILEYGIKEIKSWFKLVSNKSKERVCVVHNNIDSTHYIKGDKSYLISFDNYLVDTPILDIYKYYKKEGFKLDFKLLLMEYNSILKLEVDELKLLYVLISMPIKIELISDEYDNTILINDFYERIYSSISVIKE